MRVLWIALKTCSLSSMCADWCWLSISYMYRRKRDSKKTLWCNSDVIVFRMLLEAAVTHHIQELFLGSLRARFSLLLKEHQKCSYFLLFAFFTPSPSPPHLIPVLPPSSAGPGPTPSADDSRLSSGPEDPGGGRSTAGFPYAPWFQLQARLQWVHSPHTLTRIHKWL